MATVTPSNPPPPTASSPASPLVLRLLPIFLAPVALLIHGYHPFAGDAGIYVAGVRHILHPALYPRNAVFVTAFTRRSIFPWILAGFVRLTRLPLPWILLTTHLFSIWFFLMAAGRLAACLFSRRSARIFAIVLTAAGCALPVAGTALVLMDPYVTARSFSTPLSLLAVAATLDRRWLRVLLLVALTIAVHPLMGAYTLAFVLLLALVALDRPRTALLLCAAAFLLAGTAFTLAHGAPVDPAYRQAVSLAPRSFLFLARWRWYEVLGLLLPLALFAVSLHKLGPRTPAAALCLASILLGTTALLIAACFVPASGPYRLVPFQVLRSFHLVYCVGLVLCGGALAAWAPPISPPLADGGKTKSLAPFHSHWRPAALLVLLFSGMFRVERLEWPGGRRVEWPGVAPANPYSQAFLWIRAHTPPDAVFAFAPRLDYRPGEDEQGFRALSERDQLADDKDAGVAAVIPALAPRWAAQRNAELSADRMSDAERLATLRPLGATWLLLPPAAATSLPCPYRNAAVQACRLGR